MICPGLIKTKFSEALWKNDKIAGRFMQHVPLKRLGEAHDLAGMAVFLASPASAYCTGGVSLVDGGYLIA
ncbi:MAG: SDR family oxidoreductase [Deinococcales bacterium]